MHHRLCESRRDRPGGQSGPATVPSWCTTRSEPAPRRPSQHTHHPTPASVRYRSRKEAGLHEPSPPITPTPRRGRGVLAAV
eukprot:3640805-Prymnesium_polylepis.1